MVAEKRTQAGQAHGICHMRSDPTMGTSVRIKKNIPTVSDLGFVRFTQILFEKVKKYPKFSTTSVRITGSDI